jgi:hypothetical protein
VVAEEFFLFLSEMSCDGGEMMMVMGMKAVKIDAEDVGSEVDLQ